MSNDQQTTDTMQSNQTLEQTENCEDFAAMFETHGAPDTHLHPGQKVQGVIISMTDELVFVDVGAKIDGLIERKDLVDASGEVTVKPGDTIEAWITAANAHEIKLSRSMSGSGVAALEDALNAAIPVQGKVCAVCKGGYTVEVLGKQAFCPGSQMEFSSSSDPAALVGKAMEFLVTKVESRGRNIVVSRRALIDRERKENMDNLLKTLKEGDIIEGKITRLASFGAFLEIAPSIEGMIHISELSWHRINTPEEAVSPDEVIKAKVLSITTDSAGRPRISLSHKQVADNPWTSIANSLQIGQTVSGKVTRLASFGAFIELLPGVDGLLPLSEMSWTKRIQTAEEAVSIGEVLQIKIKDINPEKQRISLSLKDAGTDPWANIADTLPVGSEITGTVETRSTHGLFINLFPGITGLLPTTVMNASSKSAALKKLNAGDSVTLIVNSIDAKTRRISLAPEGTQIKEDSSWKAHAKPVQEKSSLATLGQALQMALKKNN